MLEIITYGAPYKWYDTFESTKNIILILKTLLNVFLI